MGIFSGLKGLFGGKSSASTYELAESYTGLRGMVFGLDPARLDPMPAPSEVYAVLMGTGYPTAVVTLFVAVDGTVSLYFSNGGGLIGLGQHAGPERAGSSFLALAQQFISRAQRTTEHPVPGPSMTRFYFLTGSGIHFAEAPENDLGEGRHAFAPLFHEGHAVIAECRMVDQQLQAAKSREN
jgi:hypothetical protein